MEDERLKIGLKVSVNTIIGNVILSVLKIVCGIAATSTAMIADGIHSLSDVFYNCRSNNRFKTFKQKS